MRIAVFGLLHLGPVISACLARRGFDVIGIDPDPKLIRLLSLGKAPLFEPGLNDLLKECLGRGKLRFTTDLKSAVKDIDLVWFTFDTPVNERDEADIALLQTQIRRLFSLAAPHVPVLISSQIPVGFSGDAEGWFKTRYPGQELRLCYTPENLRLGSAIANFENPGRLVAGTRRIEDRAVFTPILSALSNHIEWMSLESAEMVKHGINSFLATSIAFTNEMATLCEKAGADAAEVERGLRTEPRIGLKAYVKAGAAFAGGTLARDIHFLIALARKSRLPAHVLKAVLKSNEVHKEWAQHQLIQRLRPIRKRRITVLGLSYKAGTDSIRRSWSVELCDWLLKQGAIVTAYDPTVKRYPSKTKNTNITMPKTLSKALLAAEAVVVGTDAQEFRAIDPAIWLSLKGSLILDPGGLLKATIESGNVQDNYFTVGRAIKS